MILTIARDVSERMKALEELKKSESLYKTIFEAVGTANAIVSSDGIVKMVNSNILEILGYEKEDLEGKNWISVMAEEEIPRLTEYQRLRAQNPNKAPSQYETKVKDKQGNVIDILVNIKQIPGTTDIIASMMDITEIRKAEQELKESEALYRTIFETTGAAKVIIDHNRIIHSVNTKTVDMTGYTKEELEGKSWTEIVHKEELEKLKEQSILRQKNSSLAPPQFETKFVDKEGNVKQVLIHINTIPGTNKIITSATDITELKQTEGELKRSESLYRTVFETSGAANLIFDAEGNVKMINSRLEEISGYSKEEIEGKRKWMEFVHPDELERLIGYNRKRLQDPDSVPSHYETRLVAKDGSILDILLSVSLIPDTTDFVASLMDITDRKKAEKKVIQQKEELSDFAHLMAHDIRNSLSAIEGFMDLIEVKYDSTYVDTINKQLVYMRNLLNRSIELAEAGRVIEKSENVDLNKLIKNCAELAIPGNIIFNLDNLPDITADIEKLSQIIKNLFENAVKHGKPNKIEVLYEETDDDLFIYVQNDGNRIDTKVVKEAFETKFSTKEMIELHGLTIVKKLIDAHGWLICLEEDKDVTSFKITIPK